MRNRVFLLVVTFVAAFGWWVNDPLPPEFSQPWKLRGFHAFTKTMSTTIDLLGYFGFIDSLKVARSFDFPPVEFPEHIAVTNEVFDGVPVRVYRRTDTKEPHPGLMYYHGGGWIQSNTTMYDALMAEVFKEVDAVIISVEYRLAPEHKFPIPFEDCVAATKYFFKNTKMFGVDSTRLAISGDSAGGNLAAAVALKLRDDKFPQMPKHQLLIYPVTQGLDTKLPSYVQNAQGLLLTSTSMTRMISYYATGSSEYGKVIRENKHVTQQARKELSKTKIRHDDLPQDFIQAPYTKPALEPGVPEVWEELKDIIGSPYFSPLMADDLTGLPDAYVFTSHYDVLRDEGVLYVNRLREAGVTVTHVHGKNNYHGSCTFFSLFQVEGKECTSNFVNYLKKL